MLCESSVCPNHYQKTELLTLLVINFCVPAQAPALNIEKPAAQNLMPISLVKLKEHYRSLKKAVIGWNY